ncbi:4Fe-4S ferredoxin iron-sulfur binding domain protein [Desulfofarcimen acetoxidans DSM 771]|uniref:4Fe-4S ferredoxin iron-sulfur binding domain protein n=1 Tax=Desulfofarcimen acetoxidans (strain ATCC 49208 / DSM 771 / KCTC 5769 / VKM B-1644 / 5575) TaxID=485916 RepID=C8W6E1_DESAS|nr:CoB--CoM heterodisulfide reductase iron-sulfur subunit A family protein [Desulfofarcimen acetoxidans]ACV62230.1 4Fe-4S ferredoxin iron-sulfur binding domain protein [Desulfofarcimen acetoxidans DSM 771]
MKRVGVFVCWCGSNIGGVVDVARLAAEAGKFPYVVHSVDYKYTCSEPGQKMIVDAIKEHRLDRVVIAACSPRLHEQTFRKTIARAGLNPYLLEIANIREHCSWVHSKEPEKATEKAIDLVRRAVAKVVNLEPLSESSIPITKRALVIGGGIAGIQTALDIADAGHKVVLLEKEPTIGGKMVMLDKTFPTMDCSACISTPKMVAVAEHPNIELLTCCEVVEVSGYIGNFTVKVKQKARFVDHTKCTGCGTCWEKCPKKVPSEFNLNLSLRKAIYIPFPQAVPNKPSIDAENCRYLTEQKCGVCQKVCPVGAIDYEQKDENLEIEVGAIVMATGYELFDWAKAYGEYGYGKYPDVITGLQFERMVNASGPTGGKIIRPSDGKEPKNVVFVKCVGSRDEAKGKAYCSRACCMYTAKHAHQVIEKIADAQAFVFYIDVRTPGKGYEEFYKRTTDEGAQYIRGRVSKILTSGDRLLVKGADTLMGRQVEVEADLVVLATAMIPAKTAQDTARLVGFSVDGDGFYQEAHPKLRPVETNTAGIFLAGTCQGPKDIPDTVAQASAAAVKVCVLFSRREMAADPMVAQVNQSICHGCLACQKVCPYKAIEAKTISERLGGQVIERTVAHVNSGLCQGCGSCTVACRSGAVNLKGFSDEQLLAEVDAICL